MELTREQFEKIAHVFPKPRGNLEIDHYAMINILLYVAENGCKWRCLPKEFGNWHTIYVRMNRWAKSGVLCSVFEALQKELLLSVDISTLSLDSSCIKVHPDGTGALKKMGSSQSAKHGEAKTRKSTQSSPMKSSRSHWCCQKDILTTDLRDEYYFVNWVTSLKARKFLWIKRMREIKRVHWFDHLVWYLLYHRS